MGIRMICFVFLLFPFSMSAQSDHYRLIEAYMKAQVDVNRFSGNVLVKEKGKVIYEKCFGKSDMEMGTALNPGSIFQVGSVTKQFTAAGIMQLEEQGRLSVNDRLSRFFPDYPKGDSITIHMLLNHTSGIFDYTSIPDFGTWMTLPLKGDSLVKRFRDLPFDFPVGSHWRYSNSGYFLLGMIIEKITGMSWRDYTYQNVIGKARLKHTDVNRWDSLMIGRAKGYEKTSSGSVNAPYISMEIPFSAGAIVSTTQDLAQWTDALYSGQVVGKGSLKKMTTPYLSKYGYALLIDSTGSHRRVWHNGGIPGFESMLAHYPDDDLTVVVISNNGSGSTKIGSAIGSIMFNEKVDIPSAKKTAQLSPSQMERFTGTYQLKGLSEIRIIYISDGKLFIRSPQEEGREMRAESSSRIFLIADPDLNIDYSFDAQGKLVSVIANQSGSRVELIKL
jgi:hypothetical protein